MKFFIKTLSVVLVLCFVFSSGFVFGLDNAKVFEVPDNYVYWKGQVADSFESGKGTDSDPYIIKTAEQLAYLSYVVNNNIEDIQNGGYYLDKTYSLANDLYLNDISQGEYFYSADGAKKWTPIGGQVYHSFTVPTGDHLLVNIENKLFVYNSRKNIVSNIDNKKFDKNETYYYTTPFKGCFLGNGHTIYGLYVKANNTYAGLFGSTAFASIEDLNIDRAYIFGDDYVGGICGYASNYTTIDSCTVNAYIDGSYDVGGIVGKACSVITPGPSSAGETISILNCKTYGYIEAYENAGGIVGCLDTRTVSILEVMLEFNKVKSNVKNCANFAQVLSYSDGAGGIVAFCSTSYNIASIEQCYNKGYVKATVSMAGGIVGQYYLDYYSSSTIMNNCFNIGSVVAREMAGGLLGLAYANDLKNSSPIKSSYNAGQVLAINYVGAIAGSSQVESSNSADINPIYCNNCAFVTGTAQNAYGDFPTTYVKNFSKGSDVLTALNDTANVWLTDINNSNGGFPELEEGEDDSGYYVLLETEYPDLIGLDKTLVPKNSTVNILRIESYNVFPHEFYLDDELLEEMTFTVSSMHTLKVNFCNRIWIDEIEITLNPSELYYTGEELCPQVVIDGMIEGKDYIIEYYADNIYPGQAWVTLSGIGKLVGNTYVVFDILKGKPEKTDAPIVEYKNCFEICLKKIEGYEYKLDDGQWQSEPIFKSLKPGTSYTVYQRVAETDYYFASEVSDGTVVTTDKQLVGISLNSKPNKTEYERNSVVDLTGATIKLEYLDGSYDIIAVEDYMIVNADTTLVGKRNIAISYKNFVTGFEIEVFEPTLNVIRGDINGDGEANAGDLALLKKVIAGLVEIDSDEVINPNVDNENGAPNAADLALLKKIIARLV